MATITIKLDSGLSGELGNILEDALIPCIDSLAENNDITTPKGLEIALELVCKDIFYYLRNKGICHAEDMSVKSARQKIRERINEVDRLACSTATINGKLLNPPIVIEEIDEVEETEEINSNETDLT
jgi:hypothetical protein